jgi:hypothetical protein
MRDVVYFHGHGSSHALITLALYAIIGAGVALSVYSIRTRKKATDPAN